MSACATCASTYGRPSNPASEKPSLPGRVLQCCSRSICAQCLAQNQRYESYCPYCQITSTPSVLPQGLKDPPAYSSLEGPAHSPPTQHDGDTLPPYYSALHQLPALPEKSKFEDSTPDVLHFVTPLDSMQSLALAYGVPISILRRTNHVFSDHLLRGRKTILIPGAFYKGGVSLSPEPIAGEDEEIRKNKIRRWMMACKVPEYDVAILYLEHADWDFAAAVDAYKDDVQWEKEHPLESKGSSKKRSSVANLGLRRFVGSDAQSGSSL